MALCSSEYYLESMRLLRAEKKCEDECGGCRVQIECRLHKNGLKHYTGTALQLDSEVRLPSFTLGECVCRRVCDPGGQRKAQSRIQIAWWLAHNFVRHGL